MSEIDLDEISRKWLTLCGGCDLGVGLCTHPEGDYRPVISRLVAEVERLLAELDEGRLTPEPTEIRTEWGVWWYGPIGDGIRLTQDKFSSWQAATQHAPTRIGDYGITRWTLRRREHRMYADHSSWSGPWQPVPTEEDTAGEQPSRIEPEETT